MRTIYAMNHTAFMQSIETAGGIEKLLRVVARLRDPEHGCPWDLKQTHRSLKPYLLEEAYEAVEAVDEADACQSPDILKDELGDVLLQVALHAQIAQDAGHFDFVAVCDAISEKLIRRHPHVFGDVSVSGAGEVVTNWEAIKKAEKGDAPQPESILDGVSKNLPALSRALETSKRAVKVGFEWPSLESLWACVMSEYDEFRAEITLPGTGNTPETQDLVGSSVGRVLDPRDISPEVFDRLEAEMGDIFFASVNLARHFKIDPEVALTRATARFTRRFQAMEALIRERQAAEGRTGQSLEEAMQALDFETWDALWNEAKVRCSMQA